MAEAPAAAGTEGDLEEKILRVLRDACSPVRTAQLVKECQAPKKELNQVLYRMMKESKVSQPALATWLLGGSGTKDAGPAALAEPSGALTHRHGAAAVPPTPGPPLSQQQEAIYKLLEAGGSRSALNIAQALGRKTAKEVNPDLYAMRSRHLLSLDQNSKSWTVYRPGDSGGKPQSTAIIYQQSPINMICQNGPNSNISIAHSEATQIGHGNVIKTLVASGESGPAASLPLHSPAPDDASAQRPPAGTWGPQDIHVERSVLKRVQLGHDNEMSVLRVPAEDPVVIPSGSPPVTAATGPEASFEVHTPKPGPQPEGDAAQQVHIKSCLIEDTAIGNSNRMTVRPGVAGPGGVTRLADSRGHPGEAGEDPAPGSEAAPHPRDSSGDTRRAAPSDVCPLSHRLDAVTLGSRDPAAAGDSGHAARTPGTPGAGGP
ncbi:Z-DNA-binding protein 1 [Dasypus novemcinctus]|uniref:Z-DNA-binding protein 1 n=1 Tax=Dasypus novemcinctus TaxID=9361 RepID=UPI000328C6B6|nr:Z-DNA-binding protein 1 [Dasypus novemcinctus]